MFCRLRVVEIAIPELRTRGADDINDLADHFVQQFTRRYRMGALRLSDSARLALVAYAWPGNVRELENTIERAVVLASGPQLLGRDLALETRKITQVGLAVPTVSSTAIPIVAEPDAIWLPSGLSLEEAERRYARAILEREGNNRSAATRALGISRNKLARLLRGASDE